MNRSLGLPALLFLTAALAGCVQSDAFAPRSQEISTFGGSWTFADPILHDAAGNVLDVSVLGEGGHAGLSWENLPRGVEVELPTEGAEPNIGVTSDGSVFVTNLERVHRSRDQGQTWEMVLDFRTPPGNAVDDYFNTADPMIWVDPATDRIFTNHMHPGLLCTYMYISDDGGDTWIDRPASCATPSLDHQKIMTSSHGPSSPFALNPVYPSVLYLCVNKIQLGTWCAASHDGGLNYAYDNMVKGPDPGCGALNGHPAPYPDGTVVVAFPLTPSDFCDKPLTVALTEDDGLTWTVRDTCAPDYYNVEVDADITVTPDGTAYLLFRHDDHQQYVARTTDKFQTCDVFRVSPPDLTLTRFTAITSGDDGSIAMSYIGTTHPQDKDATPSDAIGGTAWHAYVTHSFNADADEPLFLTQRVTPDQDPIQIGCAWEGGGGGGPKQCRNMLDFIDMVSDAEGRYYVAMTDGCVIRNGCAGDGQSAEYQSRDRQTVVLVQSGGMGLRGALVDNVPLTHPERPPEVSV